MQDPDFSEITTLICKEDPRFDRKAYDFVRAGLDHAVKELRKKDVARAERSRHVSGPELLDGLRVYALDQFGPLTKTVLTPGACGAAAISATSFSISSNTIFFPKPRTTAARIFPISTISTTRL